MKEKKEQSEVVKRALFLLQGGERADESEKPESEQPIPFEDREASYSLTDIRILQGKPDDMLRTIHEVKLVFGGGRVLQ